MKSGRTNRTKTTFRPVAPPRNSTSTPAVGAWVSESGGTVYENVNIVYAYCTSAQAITEFGNVIALCEYVKKEMSQEAVTLEYNGQVKFI